MKMIDVIKRKWFVFPCVLAFMLSSEVVISLKYCHRGSYYLMPNRGKFVCPLCPPGTFMPFHDHRYTECFDCMKVEDDTLEILITSCNGTHDAVIHCVPGYYRKQPRNSRERERCEKCSDCGIYSEILPCRTYDDVHCCHSKNYEVLPNKDGVPMCVERPWLCRQGAFFNTESFRCFPCPADTYMPLDYHCSTECLKCYSSSRENLPKHGIIIQPCNKTHQAVVGCMEGFYINHTMGYQNKDIGCSPCKICSPANGLYESRECGRAQDTVCCPQPNMTVIDTPAGPECRASSIETPSVQTMSSLQTTLCGKDKYMDIKDKEDTVTILTTCKPCPRGTFMNESKHNSTSCKNCEEFTEDPRPPSCPPVVTRVKQCEAHKDELVVGLVGCIAYTLLLSAILCLTARYAPVVDIKRFLLFCRKGRNLSEINTALDAEEPLLKQVTQNRRGGHQICFSADHPQEREGKCRNKDRHQKYITVAEFDRWHLPICWHFLTDYIRAVADITVKLSVKKISENRPAGYPLYKLKSKHGLTAYGSGMIMHVSWFTKKSPRTCPCGCDKPWGEVEVFSANHAVFDDFECRHTICELSYDTEEERDSCQELEVVGLRYNNVEIDYCIVRCVIHDKGFSDRLEKKIQRFRSFKECKSESEDVDPIAVIVSHPHGMNKRISVGRLLRREEVAPYGFIYDTQTCEGSGGAPVCILGEGGGAFHIIALHGGQNEAGEDQSGGTILL